MRHADDNLHLRDQLLRMLEQFLVVVLNVFHVVLKARDLLVDGILLGLDFFFRQVPRHLFPQIVDLRLDVLRFLAPCRVGNDPLVLRLKLTQFQLLILGFGLFLADPQLFVQQVPFFLHRVDLQVRRLNDLVPLPLVPLLDQVEDCVFHFDLGIQHVRPLLLAVFNRLQDRIPQVDLHLPDLLALFIHRLIQRINRRLIVDQLFRIVLVRLLELVQVVGNILVRLVIRTQRGDLGLLGFHILFNAPDVFLEHRVLCLQDFLLLLHISNGALQLSRLRVVLLLRLVIVLLRLLNRVYLRHQVQHPLHFGGNIGVTEVLILVLVASATAATTFLSACVFQRIHRRGP